MISRQIVDGTFVGMIGVVDREADARSRTDVRPTALRVDQSQNGKVLPACAAPLITRTRPIELGLTDAM